jgi:flagellar protein FlaG
MMVTRPEPALVAANLDRVAGRSPRDAAREDRPAPAAEVPRAEAAAVADYPLRNLSVRMDPETNKVVVKVIDSVSGEVVREIPPDELARIDRDLGPRTGRLVEREG